MIKVSDRTFINDHILYLANKDKKKREEEKVKTRTVVEKNAKNEEDAEFLRKILDI